MFVDISGRRRRFWNLMCVCARTAEETLYGNCMLWISNDKLVLSELSACECARTHTLAQEYTEYT